MPDDIQTHFEHFPELLRRGLPLEIALSYMFYRVELAHRDTLYCGVVKLHHADSRLARSVVQNQHITRDFFKTLFQNVFGQPLHDAIRNKLAAAEKIRDAAMHGSEPTEAKMREAIVDVLEYALMFNRFVLKLAHFPPFGDLRGALAGRERIQPTTSRWLMKGFGFILPP
ncbi:MAG TPA: hypothetical protein VMP11_02870 [Verrucomicrobiae bacterium]|nr:hypothetical protein [Verrucomicrobiae bacterium]